MKKILAEFREFIQRGSVIDLAVGVIIGGAFQKIVTSLVNDLLMPWIGLLTGGVNFSEQFVILKVPEGVERAAITSSAKAAELGVTVFNYGAFITAVIDFLIVAFMVFLLVRLINRLQNFDANKLLGKKSAAEPEPEPAPTTKICPFCKSEIAIDATRCPHCTSELPNE